MSVVYKTPNQWYSITAVQKDQDPVSPYCTLWKGVSLQSPHLRSGELCSTSLKQSIHVRSLECCTIFRDIGGNPVPSRLSPICWHFSCVSVYSSLIPLLPPNLLLTFGLDLTSLCLRKTRFTPRQKPEGPNILEIFARVNHVLTPLGLLWPSRYDTAACICLKSVRLSKCFHLLAHMTYLKSPYKVSGRKRTVVIHAFM